jgi:hypothetical protein
MSGAVLVDLVPTNSVEEICSDHEKFRRSRLGTGSSAMTSPVAGSIVRCAPGALARDRPRWSQAIRLYRERNLIERFFSKLKHFRRVATRYDKLAANFLAMVQLASLRLWLRAYESTA